MWLCESVTCAMKVAVPLASGVPDRTPAADRLRLMAVSCVPPAVTAQLVYVPEPPVAASGCEYARLMVPDGRVVEVVMLSVGLTVKLVDAVAAM